MDPKDFKVAGEGSKGEGTITAYQNAFERFENWVFGFLPFFLMRPFKFLKTEVVN